MTFFFRRLRGDIFIVLVFSSVFALSALAQDANATKQVPAGSTAVMGPTKGGIKTDTAQGKMLNSALTPETRKTLQEAMDSAPAPK